MILVLFCVWEDAKSGLITISPLIGILTVEDPYPVFSISGCAVRGLGVVEGVGAVDAMADGLMVGNPVVYWTGKQHFFPPNKKKEGIPGRNNDMDNFFQKHYANIHKPEIRYGLYDSIYVAF